MLKKSIIGLLLCLCSFASAEAADGLILTGLYAQSPDPMGEWQTLTLPIKRSGNLIFIEARIDSTIGDFILDTGAPYLVLNRTYFRDLDAFGAFQTAGADGSNSDGASRTKIKQLNIGNDLSYQDLDADITNLSQLENKRGIRILGLLGTNLFERLKIEVDLNAGNIILYRLQENGAEAAPLSDSLHTHGAPDLKLPFRFCDNKIFIPVTISGQEMNWILDTGAETNVVDAFARKKVLDTFHVRRRMSLSGTSGEKQEVLVGFMDEIKVGQTPFALQQTMVTSMREMSDACSIYIDGILGYSFLSKGRFTLNFKTKEFCLYLYNWQ